LADTHHCPFCNVEVDEDMLVFGGTCPQCFGEIPGEEAATDPGEEVKAKQHAQDAKRLRRRMLLPVAMAFIMAITILTTALALLFWPKPPMAMLDLDDDKYAMLDVDYDVAVEAPVADPKAARGGKRGAGKLPASNSPAPKTGISGFKLDPNGLGADLDPLASGQTGPGNSTVRAGTRGSSNTDLTVDAAPTTHGNSNIGGGGLFDDSVGNATITRSKGEGVRLTDDNAIIQMVQKVMRDELKRLKTCYTDQLKVDETLQGAWVLNFTVAASGKTKEVSIAAKDAENTALEQCMAKKMNTWEFQPIKADLPVRKTVTFRPS